MDKDYYQTCPFPKSMGTPKRSKKKQNGYKAKVHRYCFYTGKPGAERHEVFPGIFRQTSIDMGFQVDVCPDIHYALQYGTTEWARQETQKWRVKFQKEYEEKLVNEGVSEAAARMNWIRLCGKSYINDMEEINNVNRSKTEF